MQEKLSTQCWGHWLCGDSTMWWRWYTVCFIVFLCVSGLRIARTLVSSHGKVLQCAKGLKWIDHLKAKAVIPNWLHNIKKLSKLIIYRWCFCTNKVLFLWLQNKYNKIGKRKKNTQLVFIPIRNDTCMNSILVHSKERRRACQRKNDSLELMNIGFSRSTTNYCTL